MADQKNPKDGSGGGRPTGPRDRVTGSVSAPNRDRNTGSISQPPRPTTTFTGVTSHDGMRPDRERSTGSISGAPERERATAPMKPPLSVPKPSGKFNVSHLMKGAGGTNSGVSNPGATTGPKQLTEHQKRMLGSAFQDSKRMEALKVAVGNTGERKRPEEDDDDEPTALGPLFDGTTPARELTGRDLFKTVQAPVQSREGRRSKQIYRQVINQFAVGNNPRYPPDGPDKPRAHIFIWDVSRAMNCEVPHFIAAKELTLGQTVDWLRHEGPTRGWMRASPEDAVNAAMQGMLVIAMPKEIRLKQLAIVVPEPPDKDGRPRLAGAAVKIGNNLSIYEALGVYAADFFAHA
jgi:hypothetical protein